MQHCPGLKQTLAPLYLSVASNPFVYGDTEKRAFDEAMQLLTNLQPFHLPSADLDVVIEIFTDASGGSGTPTDPGSWAAALGQRKGVPSLDNPSLNFELLQLDGGLFNARRAEWDILKKEASALFQALHRFRQYIFGRRIRIFTDSKVLMHMFRSDSPVLKRWYAYLQTYDYEMFHISSSANALVDCLSRYVVDPATSSARVPRLLALATKTVPAPSLLQCGDVEPNPGPPKPIVIESSSSDPSLSPPPTVAPVASNSPNAGDKRQPRRRARGTPSPQAPAQQAPASAPIIIPSQQDASQHPLARVRLETTMPSTTRRAHQASAAARVDVPAVQPRSPQAQPEARYASASPPADYRRQLLRLMYSRPGPSSFCDSLAEALRDEHHRSNHALGLSVPFDSLYIRDRVLWFLESSGSQPLSLLYGQSFEQTFRADIPLLSFANVQEQRTPDSWTEYRSLMADRSTFPDYLFVQAACIVYSVQIVCFTEDDRTFDVSPANAFRRVFLFASDRGKHFDWAKPVEPDDEDANAAVAVTFDVPQLRASAAHIPRPAAFSHSLDISEDKMLLIHAAHNAYTGHPGVEATVRRLMADGHKWRRMTAHIAQFIKRCPTCCSSRLQLLRVPVSAATVRFHARPLRRWHVDQTGSMGPCHSTGFSILLVFICEVTQFTVLYGSRHGTALEAAAALINLMGWLDLAESIHSDGGPENDNYIWHQVAQITGIKHTFSVPNVPNSNPIAERNIGMAKRFVRALTVDLDKHNTWGLLLPIAQKGLNDLRRKDLLWYSPNEIVFASLSDPTSLVIPTFYTRAVREADLADANAYQVSANFIHRAMCFQQHVCGIIGDIHAKAFDASAATNPTACTDLSIGQCVLISWPSNQPPSPVHPLKRGPYKVTAIQRNSVQLEHLSNPPPADQPLTILWSKHAHVYQYVDEEVPARSALDPAASQAPTGPPGRNIDCVLSHSALPTNLLPPGVATDHVKAQKYLCRLFSGSSSRLPPALVPTQLFSYEQIAHTYAFDTYVLSQRYLHGHVPSLFMPANWNPHAVPPPLRPSHPPLPVHEHAFPPNDDDDRFSQ